jgi:hypothetical protein
VKEEGWWLVVGDTSTGELYALKRVGFLTRASAKLKVPAAALDGDLMLYCMSDCYLGLDQQITLASRPGGAAPRRPKLRVGAAPPPHAAAEAQSKVRGVSDAESLRRWPTQSVVCG